MVRAKQVTAEGGLQASAGTPAHGRLAGQLFRKLFDDLPNPAYIWRQEADGDFRLVDSNRAATEVPFSKVDALVGQRVADLQSGNLHDLLADLNECLRTGTVLKHEVDYRYIASGALRRLALTLVPLADDIVVLHTEDVTEQRRAEQALKESERKYRTIVDTANDGVWAVDADGRTTYVNRRTAEILGYRPDEMLGRTTFEFVDRRLHPEVLDARKRRRAGATERFDFELKRKDGSAVWVAMSASPVYDESGAYAGSIAMFSDITARRRAEQALRESEARVRALLDANPDMIVCTNREGVYLEVRARTATTEYLPIPPDRFLGRRVDEIFDADFARQHERYRHAALDTGQLQLWEYVRTVNGHVRHLEARFVKSGDDEVVITIRDITERVELEQQVIGSVERERERVGHDLHDGLAQLLTGIKLWLEPLKDKLVAERSPHGNAVERAVALVGQAIGDTRELARGLSPIPRSATFTDALRELAEQSERLLGIRCHVAEQSAPAHLSDAAAMHVYRIAQEAITNAARHGRASDVWLTCSADGERLTLDIADNGIGIDQSRAGGTGLGLRIMSYRARSIGGDLCVRQRAEGGTSVTLSCPLDAVTA